MTAIMNAILGFLSWRAMSGYDLKKRFAQSDVQYWSGNNNQIYRALVDLHKLGLVTKEIDDPETGPSRKIYTITDRGRAALRDWVTSHPELPELRNAFHVQLIWADLLESDELDQLLKAYEGELTVKLQMLDEEARRGNEAAPRTDRERLLWEGVAERWQDFYRQELAWARRLRQDLARI